MKPRLTTCLPRWRAATLIEVLAGLAILGSVTVALLLARGNLLAQHATAQQKLEAVRIADRLLGGWYAEGSTIPMDEQGAVEGHPGWSWQTQTVEMPSASDDPLPTGMLRVELFSANSPTPQSAIVTVEIVIPTENDAADSAAGGPA